ncbi:MAG: hypothetical protein QM655_15505 [Nocardioidaceae bacterium]
MSRPSRRSPDPAGRPSERDVYVPLDDDLRATAPANPAGSFSGPTSTGMIASASPTMPTPHALPSASRRTHASTPSTPADSMSMPGTPPTLTATPTQPWARVTLTATPAARLGSK